MTWTPAWERQLGGAGTHAFVIGVSSYPDAKPGKGHLPVLRGVPDIASADASALLVADWLCRNCDALSLPLATLDVLLGGAPVAPGRKQYVCTDLQLNLSNVPVPSTANVKQAGAAWLSRLQAVPGSIALFFICGHGAAKGGEHLVFLEDLNRDDVEPWAHLNVSRLALAFKQQEKIRAAMFFVDACQEFVPELAVADTAGGARFVPSFDPFQPGEEKVALFSASSHALLAYEGDWKSDPQVKVGRYTETLVEAFGTSVRYKGGRWLVHSNSIAEDLKALHRVSRPDWRAQKFEPSFGLTPNEIIPLAEIKKPTVPVSILTEPTDKMSDCDLCVVRQGSELGKRAPGSPDEWVCVVPASLSEHIIEARVQDQTHSCIFVPMAPIFDARISVG